MNTIRELIEAKRQQIAVLERHVRELERMDAEEEGRSPRARRGRPAAKPRGRRRGRRPRGESRADLVGTYLQKHSGPQPAREIAAALNMTPAEVHSSVNPGLKTGRFTRGKDRGTYALGSGKTTAPATRRKARRSRKGKAGASRKRKVESAKEAEPAA